MNIFYLDTDPAKAAAYVCDVHTVSQPKEAVQMLSTVSLGRGGVSPPKLDGKPYKAIRDSLQESAPGNVCVKFHLGMRQTTYGKRFYRARTGNAGEVPRTGSRCGISRILPRRKGLAEKNGRQNGAPSALGAWGYDPGMVVSMITWKENDAKNKWFAVCGEYRLIVNDWGPREIEGVFYRMNICARLGQTGYKPTADEAKTALLDLVFEQIKKDVRAQSETIAAFWDLKRSMDRDELCKDEKPSTRSVRELIDAGYMQVSSKYRILARVPPGKTALQAIEDENPEFAAQVRNQCENLTRSHYLRICGRKDQVELSIEAFKEFKRLRGPVA